MRKTHKTTMANKQHLIEDLQDIIEERDRMIRQLQGDDDTESTARDMTRSLRETYQFVVLVFFCLLAMLKSKSLMSSVSVVTVVFIHTMEDNQRLNTLVHEGDTLHFHFIIARRQKITEYSTCCLNKFCFLFSSPRVIYINLLIVYHCSIVRTALSLTSMRRPWTSCNTH